VNNVHLKARFLGGVLFLFCLGIVLSGCDCGDPVPITLDTEGLEQMAGDLVEEKQHEGVELYYEDDPFRIYERPSHESEEDLYGIEFEYKFVDQRNTTEGYETMKNYSHDLALSFYREGVTNLDRISVYWEDEHNKRWVNFEFQCSYDGLELIHEDEYYYGKDEEEYL